MNRYLPGSKNPDRAEPIPESDGQAQSASVPNGGTLREEAYWPNTMEVEEPSGLSCHSYISPSHHKRNPADFPQVRSCSVPSVEGEHFQVGADLPIDVAGDDSVHLENESIRTRSHLESRSITARDLAIGFQELDRQNVLDRVKLESTSLTKGQREEIATALQNRSQVLTSLSVYAQPSSVANWYTPFTRAPNSRDGVQSDALWGIQLIHRRILLLLVNGNVLDFDIPVLLFKGVLLVVWYFVLYFVLQRTIASPGGAVFDTLVCVALSSIIGGTLSTLVALPALIGILVSAIVWNSLPGSLAGAIPSIVKKISKNVGATIIVLKAGLSIDLEGMRSTLLPSFCLATLSVLGEALFHYIFAYFVYHMDHITAWLYGIALSGTSPAIVVPAGFYLQALGRGVKSGILPMLFTSVASNVTFCLLVFNILFDIKYPVGGSSNLGLLLGLIPVQVIGGPVIGIALGYAVIFMLRIIVARRGAHDRSYYSASVYLTTSMLGLSLLLTFAGGFLSVPGGATLAVFCLALSVKYFVPSDVEYQEEFEKASHSVSVLWDVLVQPFLFGLIGASTTLMHLFAWSNLKYYLASGLIGVAARTLFVIPILRLTSRLELKEMIYVSFALCARATPQAALGGNLSDRVYAYPDQYSEEVEEFGEIIHVQSLLAIFLLGPLSAILMKVFGSRLTRSDAEVESSTQWSSTSQNGVENTNENESEKSVTENRMAAPTSPRMLTQFSSPSTILRMPGPSPRRSNMPASPGRSTGQHVAFRLHSDAMPIGMDQERDLLNCRRRPVTSAQTGGLSHGPSENCARDATSASVCSSLQVMDATKFEQGPQTRFDNEPNTRIFHTEGDPELDSTSEDDSVYSNPA